MNRQSITAAPVITVETRPINKLLKLEKVIFFFKLHNRSIPSNDDGAFKIMVVVHNTHAKLPVTATKTTAKDSSKELYILYMHTMIIRAASKDTYPRGMMKEAQLENRENPNGFLDAHAAHYNASINKRLIYTLEYTRTKLLENRNGSEFTPTTHASLLIRGFMSQRLLKSGINEHFSCLSLAYHM